MLSEESLYIEVLRECCTFAKHNWAKHFVDSNSNISKKSTTLLIYNIHKYFKICYVKMKVFKCINTDLKKVLVPIWEVLRKSLGFKGL